MWRHYVYLHHRHDNGAPFYVGKGSHRNRNKRATFERAHARNPRNWGWHNIVHEHGLRVEIVAMCKTDEAAQELEVELIAKIGRRDLGRGPLVNVTDGGDGHAGILVSAELRRKRSQNAKGPRSDAWVSAIRAARKGGGNGGVVKRGDKLPESWRKNLAAGKIGAKNPWFGKPTPASKKVKNVKTGVIYSSIAQAAKAEGIATGRLYSILDGQTKVNVTDLVIV